MSIFSEFIPEIWASALLLNKEAVHVFGNKANRNYEGDISQAGDTVRISSIGTVTVNNYTRNSTSDLTLQTLDQNQIQLLIDQEKYFNFRVDQVDIKQSKPEFVSEATRRAGYELASVQDKYLASLYAEAGINQGATAVVLGSSNIETVLLNVATLMDEANVQRMGRYIIVPPWAHQHMIAAGIDDRTANDGLWQNGFAGRAYGFDIIMSNNVSNTASTSVWQLLAGVGNESFTLAEQILDPQMADLFQAQKGFGQIIGGLHVYGARIISDRTAVIPASKA
jgi:hypothetical protein